MWPCSEDWTKKIKKEEEKIKINKVYSTYQKISSQHQKHGTTHLNQWTSTLICICSKLLQASFFQLTTTHNYIWKCKKRNCYLCFKLTSQQCKPSALTINVHHQRLPPSRLRETASNYHDTHCDDVAEPLWEPSISRNPLHFTHSLDLAQCMADTSPSSSILIGPGASGSFVMIGQFQKAAPSLCVYRSKGLLLHIKQCGVLQQSSPTSLSALPPRWINT